MDDLDAHVASDPEGDTAGLPPSDLPRSARRWEIMALVASFALVIAGVFLLPFVVRSMVTELSGGQDDTLYDLITGEVLLPGADVDPNADEYLNIAAVALEDELEQLRTDSE